VGLDAHHAVHGSDRPLALRVDRQGTGARHHEEFVKPLWKQGVGSTVHCVAGDATGIITAAVITAAVGLPMWQDLIVEYLAGFAFGLFIFQSLFMKGIMGGTYLNALRRAFVPEGVSMNMMMAGMAPTMVLLMMGRNMRAMEPSQPTFWLVMVDRSRRRLCRRLSRERLGWSPAVSSMAS